MNILILITTANKKEAEKIARSLVKERLAACVNIVAKIESIFWWQDKVSGSRESLLIVKSRRSKLNNIIKRVKSLHSYQLPEIVALPIVAGERKYLKWLDESIR
jgi:periplasmic divalent cation tolerance protein